ncbi:MAG: hypothetical protein AAFN93_07175 [Bacteroidota bacterium]
MKYLQSALFIIALFAFVSCGGNTDNNTEGIQNEMTEEEVKEVEALEEISNEMNETAEELNEEAEELENELDSLLN